MNSQKKPANKETINFNADISQLMNLIINAFYSKKEIFLRELLSNSSDALEKIRYEALTNKNILNSSDDLKIKIWTDEKNLYIEDFGIGMTKKDLINNLGTIASSGTKQFIEKNNLEIDQIGQFGVGFYSSFLVAKRVTIYTKHNDEDEYIWQSNANKSFTITKNKKPILKRGTRIVLELKEEEDEYLDIAIVKSVIKKYAQFINFPIEIKELLDSDEYEWIVVNNQKPLWCRNPDDVKVEEYNEFYKTISNDYNNPLTKCHFKTEGQLEFNCLLYIPEKSQYDLFESKDKSKNIKLYVKRIFIMDDCEELCPEWLKFMKGIVDSKDVPLNVSRELLQQNRVLKQINKIITKKCLDLFNELTSDVVTYNKFYNNYSKMLKLGVHEDNRNRNKILNLLRFYSVNSENNYISLDDYIDNMKENQNKIYYITGQNKSSLISSPFIEKLKDNGFDILLFTDPIDEYWVQSVRDYKDKKMVDVSKDGINFDNLDVKAKEEKYSELISFLKEELGDKIQSVKVSDRLNNAPCVLVVSEYGWSANMERIVRAQALRNEEMDKMIGTQRILEINLDHKIMKTLAKKIKVKKNINQCKHILNIVFSTAMINSGFTLEKPNDYANKINQMIEIGFC